MGNAQKWLSQLCFPESPRCHNGAFYFVDMYEGEIWTIDYALSSAHASPQLVLKWHNFVSGLGWLPSGEMLFVDMTDRRVMKIDLSGNVGVHADLSTLASGWCNDMVVDEEGITYVSNFGYDIHNNAEFKKTPLIRVDPQGNAEHCSVPLAFPNGIIISEDKTSLIVAESVASRLVKFAISDQGKLVDRQKFADIANGFPDGICFDNNNCVWIAAIGCSELLQLNMQGEIINQVTAQVDGQIFQPIACVLSPLNTETNMATLFITAAPNDPPSKVSPDEEPPSYYRRRRQGAIFKMEVPAATAGFP